MLCDICKKNQATIHIHEIIDGKKKEFNLCAECAAKKTPEGLNIGPFNLGEVLFNLDKISTPDMPPHPQNDAQPPPSAPEPVCPECGWTLEKVRASGGRLGCPDCYRTFRPMIEAALSNIHRGKVHMGKRPHENRREDGNALLLLELSDRQRELQTLIAAEEYEKAAGVRDRINDLKLRIAAGKDIPVL